MKNISFSGLKTALLDYAKNREYAECQSWCIINGGYDSWWELWYNGQTVLQCIDGELQGGFRPFPEFTEETEKQLIARVKDVYKDLK